MQSQKDYIKHTLGYLTLTTAYLHGIPSHSLYALNALAEVAGFHSTVTWKRCEQGETLEAAALC